jgi:hypothetical protein
MRSEDVSEELNSLTTHWMRREIEQIARPWNVAKLMDSIMLLI